MIICITFVPHSHRATNSHQHHAVPGETGIIAIPHHRPGGADAGGAAP